MTFRVSLVLRPLTLFIGHGLVFHCLLLASPWAHVMGWEPAICLGLQVDFQLVGKLRDCGVGTNIQTGLQGHSLLLPGLEIQCQGQQVAAKGIGSDCILSHQGTVTFKWTHPTYPSTIRFLYINKVYGAGNCYLHLSPQSGFPLSPFFRNFPERQVPTCFSVQLLSAL